MKDLNLLYVFEAMWRDRSVTLAAEKLGLTRAAVSSALKRMRQEHSDKMFAQVGRVAGTETVCCRPSIWHSRCSVGLVWPGINFINTFLLTNCHGSEVLSPVE
jgi:hypothetical protein